MMTPQLLTGAIAAIGLLIDFGGSGPARAQDDHAAHAASAQSHRHADFASDRLHVRIDGAVAGPGVRDIILIPGLSSSPEVWDGVVDHLESEPGSTWRIHRIHVQGFAGAPAEANAQTAGAPQPVAAPVAEEIARYITENHIAAPVVVGHSMGGTIGLMLAARHPELVGKLMVVDMVPFVGALFGPFGTTANSIIPTADQIYAAQSGAAPTDYHAQAATTVSSMVRTDAHRAGPLEDAARSDQQVASAAYRELIVTDLRPELSKITAPTEVVYAKFNDPRLTAEISDGIYRMSYATLPGVTLKRIDDSAHFVMLDQPDAFDAELDAFLAQ